MKRLLIALLILIGGFPSLAHAERQPYSRKERREIQKAMLKVLSEAREKNLISRGQKFRLGLLFRLSPRKCCEAMEAAAPEIAELEGMDPAKFGSEDATGLASESGLYRVEVGNIAALIELLIKYLPQIIALIQELFPADNAEGVAPPELDIPTSVVVPEAIAFGSGLRMR